MIYWTTSDVKEGSCYQEIFKCSCFLAIKSFFDQIRSYEVRSYQGAGGSILTDKILKFYGMIMIHNDHKIYNPKTYSICKHVIKMQFDKILFGRIFCTDFRSP